MPEEILPETEKNETEMLEPENAETEDLETKNLQDLFSSNLVIPDYQRTYGWEDKNVTDLWDNLLEMPHNSDYHLGSIILQRRTVNDCTLYNIIDGQQRLVTLTLITVSYTHLRAHET